MIETGSVFSGDRDIPRLHGLAQKGIFLGTSSWKYEGWLEQIYLADYLRTLKGERVLNKSKFEKECLVEYAAVFPTVCNDSMYYRLPDRGQLEGLEQKLPSDFRMTFKCPELITLRQSRSFGGEPVKMNESYLDARIFSEYVLKPIDEIFKEKLGAIIFEFSPFFFDEPWAAPSDYGPEEFVADLDGFLKQLPRGYEYGVEVRDPILILPGYEGYLDILRANNVSHVINAQTWMPSIEEQVLRPGILTADHIIVRALTKRGMKHEQAVKKYSPYSQTQEPMPAMREAIATLIAEAIRKGKKFKGYFNNRAEGNAPNTIHGILDILEGMGEL
ncbi:MAG: DUF72 domain-containing protein [Ignavibacteriota bacterium]